MTGPTTIGSLERLYALLGIEANATGHLEKLVSGLGGFLGILAVVQISSHFVADSGAAWIVASMGASAVLLFAVPHGPLSQPWPLVGGHLISALVGVTCAKLVPDLYFSSALAVAIAISGMHYLRCIHPPGGATALTAVAGGAGVHALGYQFMLTPVLLNVMTILLIAVVVNFWLPWRRYPAALLGRARHAKGAGDEEAEEPPLVSHEDVQYALREIGSFIDVTEDDLERILELASDHSNAPALDAAQIRNGRCYSNGRFGSHWAVRQVVAEHRDAAGRQPLVVYRGVAGPGRNVAATCTRQEFARWARHEVFLNENSWQRTSDLRRHETPEASP